MSNYNTALQNNNSSLEEIINKLNAMPEAGIDTSDATATEADILNGKTAYVDGEKITGSISSVQGKTIIPNTSNQTAISTGQYAEGNITVIGDSNLKAENIASGVSIFGVSGTYRDRTVDNIIDRTATEINNSIITSIGNYAFMRYSNLMSISFPACVTIGSQAFAYCPNLTSVYFPNCTSFIGYYAFAWCSNLSSVYFPKCPVIASSTFYNCSNLTSVSFPSCISIYNSAFISCNSLVSVNFPLCRKIYYAAFSSCKNLATVSFPQCIDIADRAFYNCSNLTSVYFPNCTSIGSSAFEFVRSGFTSVFFPSCTTIGNSAFRYCFNLTFASFPYCSKIGASAFENCSSLTSLYLGASSVATLLNINAFTDTPMSISTLTGSFGSIFVPASLVEAYKSATNWTTYAARITAI